MPFPGSFNSKRHTLQWEIIRLEGKKRGSTEKQLICREKPSGESTWEDLFDGSSQTHGADTMFGRGCWGCTRGTCGKAEKKGETQGGKPVAGAPLDGFQPASHSFRVLKGCFPLTLYWHLNQEVSGAANLSASICISEEHHPCDTGAPHHRAFPDGKVLQFLPQ